MALLCAAACSGNGDDGFSGAGGIDPNGLLADALTVVAHDPADGAVQVALDAAIEVELDGVLAQECLQEPDTWLQVAGGSAPIPGTFAVSSGGKRLTFRPQSPLRRETDYRFQLSAFTCDIDGRLLEEEYAFTFRSYDESAPRVLSASIPGGATGVARDVVVEIECDEALDPASVRDATVYLRDVYGTAYACALGVEGERISVDPLVDLPGSRSFVLVVAGIEDRAGNRHAPSWSVGFTTEADHTGPSVVAVWPDGLDLMSPLVHPTIRFDESVDVFSFETASLLWVDEHANVVPYSVVGSPDQRTVRLVPRAPLGHFRKQVITLVAGPGALTDLTGNPLSSPHSFEFETGDDATGPVLTSADPLGASTPVPRAVQLHLGFSEDLDPSRVDPDTVRLTGPAGSVAATIRFDSPSALTVVPGALLEPGASYQLALAGGADGLRDPAGNPMPADEVLTFEVNEDADPPELLIWPYDGAFSVPTGVHVSAAADSPLDPSTVGPDTFSVSDSAGSPVPGTISVERGARVVRFTPAVAWTPGSTYRAVLRGGPDGIREPSGNWLSADVVSSFRIGFTADATPPRVDVSVNRIDDTRNQTLTLPPYGFTIDVEALDPEDYSLDMSTVSVTLAGAGATPGAETMFAEGVLDGGSLRYRLPRSAEIQPGTYTLVASVADLSGNVGTSAALSVEIKSPDLGALPFERTQVVWVRFDLDRDGNGRPDLEDDLLRLGLATEGDPSGTNARMTEIVRDGILARCHELFSRKPNGGRRGQDSVGLRFSHRRPLGVPSSQIACGGLDPEGSPGRQFGDDSTGTLGRAYFDYRNGQINDHAIASNPGLGVFPGELFLFEAKVHLSVYPSFLTTFARRFLNICPSMGGVPAGQHPLDTRVLAAGFDYASATSSERARFNAVFAAADDWTTAVGVILAHETGHAVGLVAEGRSAVGLHGDASLHNEFSSLTDVMSSSVGYESLVNLDYQMRDLNLAYLRQRVLLK